MTSPPAVASLSADSLRAVYGGEDLARPAPAPSTWDTVKRTASDAASGLGDAIKGCGKGLALDLAGEPQGPIQRDAAALCTGEFLGTPNLGAARVGLRDGIRRLLRR